MGEYDYLSDLEKNCEEDDGFYFWQKSSIGVGGKAKTAYYPSDVTSLMLVIDELEKRHEPYRVLGNLTNVLPSDENDLLSVVKTTKLKSVGFGKNVFALCGATSSAFLNACELQNRGGAEFLEGIPCTLGGAIYMNAGAYGKHISDIVESVLVYVDGKLKTLDKSECRYSYKHSIFMEKPYVIVGASFLLPTEDERKIAETRQKYAEDRLRLPTGKSMGCVFKNPKDLSAGSLIESCGLSMSRVGDAVVSDTHANFILNTGRATAKDVKTLIEKIKTEVFEKTGVLLEEEIIYL